MKNLFCLLFHCTTDASWRECPRCQLKRVKLMRQMRRRRRATMLGLIALSEPCPRIMKGNARPAPRRFR